MIEISRYCLWRFFLLWMSVEKNKIAWPVLTWFTTKMHCSCTYVFIATHTRTVNCIIQKVWTHRQIYLRYLGYIRKSVAAKSVGFGWNFSFKIISAINSVSYISSWFIYLQFEVDLLLCVGTGCAKITLTNITIIVHIGSQYNTKKNTNW